MMDQMDFKSKQIVFFVPMEGDKLSFKNDNLIVTDKEGGIKFQVTCYRVFIVFILGDTTITTGLINRANKFGISLCFMNRNMKVYKFMAARMEGNTYLRKRQYEYAGLEIGQYIILNKVSNQRNALMNLRKKTELQKEAIEKLDQHINRLKEKNLDLQTILGIEGSASRTYFPQIFDNVVWKGRKPRIKNDYLNATLDIGYTILFNVIDALINVYGFDEYKGVLHTNFYMRKSLVCDLMEPFRPMIDYSIRKYINLGQIKAEDFKIDNHKYILEWKNSSKYAKLFLSVILENREDIFLYLQSYYRMFMRQKDISEYPFYEYGGKS